MHPKSMKHLIDIFRNSEVRLLVVGGASTLYVDGDKSITLLDSFGMHKDDTSVPGSMALAFDELRKRDDVVWTYLSPSQNFSPDIEDTGGYREGRDKLMYNSLGKSEISYNDYAMAMIDEAEDARHIKERFTVVNKA